LPASPLVESVLKNVSIPTLVLADIIRDCDVIEHFAKKAYAIDAGRRLLDNPEAQRILLAMQQVEYDAGIRLIQERLAERPD
jgi:hypothetical protein